MTARIVQGGFTSPTLKLKITEQNWEDAVQASSGGCLIADAIKKQYPNLTGVHVDMVQIRATDREKGLRYHYLTPESAQTILLAYDQGWDQPENEVRVKRAIKVTLVQEKSPRTAEHRRNRIAELEAKQASGEPMTPGEKGALKRMKAVKRRPLNRGSAQISADGKVVHGGAVVLGPDNPNLLRGRSRIYGAKSARPSQLFEQAVEKAVSERLAAMAEE
jgi:hypothetical protein